MQYNYNQSLNSLFQISLDHRCSGCHYPICDGICDEKSLQYHEKYECHILQKLGNKGDLDGEGK